MTVKEKLMEAISDLPDNASYDEAFDKLIFLQKIDEGIAQIEKGEGIPHEDIIEHFKNK